jgi:hypothetical protein
MFIVIIIAQTMNLSNLDGSRPQKQRRAIALDLPCTLRRIAYPECVPCDRIDADAVSLLQPRRPVEMLELYFFILGLVNSVVLIVLFLVRKKRLDLVNRFGRVYFLLAIPAAYGIFLAQQEDQTGRYGIFLGIFLAFLFVEWLFDYALRINFRENWKRNWKLTVPYLALYYAMNYGFVVMPWKTSLAWGLVMAGLFIIQIIANLRSHP